jgi:hypothetical protein
MPDGSPQLINRLRALINFYISVTHRSKVSVIVFAKHRDSPRRRRVQVFHVSPSCHTSIVGSSDFPTQR